jgi:MarR family transcriptional repressor of emrRAB
MSSFAPTEQHLAITARRYPAFPRQAATVMRLIRHLQRRVHDQANAALKPWGINHPQYNLLMMMYGTEDYSLHPSQLAEAAGEKSANITRLTNELCAMGLIERGAAADDRRKVTLRLTAAGLALIDAYLPDVRALLRRQSAGLDATELTQLQRLLRRLLDNLDAA